MGLGSAERDPAGGSQPERPLVPSLTQPQNPLTQPSMSQQFPGSMGQGLPGPPGGRPADPANKPQNPLTFNPAGKQVPPGTPMGFQGGDMDSLPLPPLPNPGPQGQGQQMNMNIPPVKAAAIAQAQAMLQSRLDSLHNQERRMHQMLHASTRPSLGGLFPRPPPGGMPGGPMQPGQMGPPQGGLPQSNFPFSGNFQSQMPNQMGPPPLPNLPSNLMPYGQQQQHHLMNLMQPSGLQNSFMPQLPGGPMGQPQMRGPYGQMDMSQPDMQDGMGGPGAYLGGMRGMGPPSQPGGFPGGMPGAPPMGGPPMSGVRRPPMMPGMGGGNMLPQNQQQQQQQQLYPPGASLPSVRPPQNIRPGGPAAQAPVLRSAQIENASGWYSRAKAQYKASFAEQSIVMQAMGADNDDGVSMEAALNKASLMV